ncbi:MAG: aspartate kinase, partial [Chitinophagaceae bacterium]
MKVFKFGGASVSTVERIQNVGSILKKYKGEQLLIIVSAMGKTTNALEKVVGAFYEGRKEVALQLFENIKQEHVSIHNTLIAEENHVPITQNPLSDFFTEIEWLLHDKPVKSYDYYYDQIVCIGEMLSSSIVGDYLNKIAIDNSWIDVRDIIRTDDNFRDAKIDWLISEQKVRELINPL